MRIRTEVTDAFASRPAVDHQSRILLVQRHRQYRIRLVVAVADVEPRVELLDPVVFQLQRLDFGVHHRPIDAARGHHHLPGARRQARDVGEVGRQPAAQALGLADVDHPAVRIPEPVDARLDGNRPGGRPVRRWIGHGFQVTAAGPAGRRAGPTACEGTTRGLIETAPMNYRRRMRIPSPSKVTAPLAGVVLVLAGCAGVQNAPQTAPGPCSIIANGTPAPKTSAAPASGSATTPTSR